jgi:hypothetical protein
MHRERLVEPRQPLQEEDALDQALDMLHFFERFLIKLFVQPEVPPILTHRGVQKILIGGRHFTFEHLVELRNDFG